MDKNRNGTRKKKTVLTCWGADIWTILVSFDVISPLKV